MKNEPIGLEALAKEIENVPPSKRKSYLEALKHLCGNAARPYSTRQVADFQTYLEVEQFVITERLKHNKVWITKPATATIRQVVEDAQQFQDLVKDNPWSPLCQGVLDTVIPPTYPTEEGIIPSPEAAAWAEKIIVKDGKDIRIVGETGCSKLLCRFETEDGMYHRLRNVRMILGNRIDQITKSASPIGWKRICPVCKEPAVNLADFCRKCGRENLPPAKWFNWYHVSPALTEVVSDNGHWLVETDPNKSPVCATTVRHAPTPGSVCYFDPKPFENDKQSWLSRFVVTPLIYYAAFILGHYIVSLWRH